MDEERVRNWYPEGEGYVFTFAKGGEAVGVKVDLKHGTIREDEEDKLRGISENIIEKGLPVLGIGPGELKAISVEDYGSDRYTHPADDVMDKMEDLREKQDQGPVKIDEGGDGDHKK
jgi:hypothetical protein